MFSPPPPYGLSSLQTKVEFAVKAVNKKGVEIVSYKLAGASQNDYSLPEPSIVFIGDDVSLENSIYNRLNLSLGDLPVGCHRVNVSFDDYSCPVTLSSTSPWKNTNSMNPSTSGVLHASTRSQNPIPISLFGFDLNYEDETKKQQTLQKLFSKQLAKKDVLEQRGTCFSLKLKPATISEFIQWDAFPTSFLRAAYTRLPEWLSFELAENNDVFHINNVAASSNKYWRGSYACAHLPIPSRHFALYYSPLINYTSTIDSETLLVEMSRDVCFAIDLCASAVYWNTGEAGTRMIKRSKISKNMKEAGWETEITSVGFVRSRTLSASKLSGVVHLEHGYENLKEFLYNMWIRGKLKFTLQSVVKISVEMEGEAFVRVGDLNNVSDFLKKFFSNLSFSKIVSRYPAAWRGS